MSVRMRGLRAGAVAVTSRRVKGLFLSPGALQPQTTPSVYSPRLISCSCIDHPPTPTPELLYSTVYTPGQKCLTDVQVRLDDYWKRDSKSGCYS